MLQVRNKLYDEFIAVDEDKSNALDAGELNHLFSKLGLAVPDGVRSSTMCCLYQTVSSRENPPTGMLIAHAIVFKPCRYSRKLHMRLEIRKETSLLSSS